MSFQVELNFIVKTQQPLPVFVRVETPCGEIGAMEFGAEHDAEQVFRPMQHGCGNGQWKIDVYQMIENRLVRLGILSFSFLDNVWGTMAGVTDWFHL